MTRSSKISGILALALVGGALGAPQRASATWLTDWLGWDRPTTVTAGYYYVPTTEYRTLYTPVAVASAPACGSCGAGATTFVQKPVLQAYTSYRIVYSPIVTPPPACGACATSYYPPAPACASCGCSACATGACGGRGCATCGFAPPACPTCGGCSTGACGTPVAMAPSIGYSAAVPTAAMYPSAGYAPSYPAAGYSAAAPTTSYLTSATLSPVTTTPYMPNTEMAGAAPTTLSGPVTTRFAVPATGFGAPGATYPMATWPAAVTSAPQPILSSGGQSPSYAMPLSPSIPASEPSIPSVLRQGIPTLAPPASGTSSADIAPSLPGPVPPGSTIDRKVSPPLNSLQPNYVQPNVQPNSASPSTPVPPAGISPDSQKTFDPSAPVVPMRPIPDPGKSNGSNSGSWPAGTSPTSNSPSSSSPHPLDPNSKTAYSMPMLRLGQAPTPWPVAKTTAALMPIADIGVRPSNISSAADADGWHAVK